MLYITVSLKDDKNQAVHAFLHWLCLSLESRLDIVWLAKSFIPTASHVILSLSLAAVTVLQLNFTLKMTGKRVEVCLCKLKIQRLFSQVKYKTCLLLVYSWAALSVRFNTQFSVCAELFRAIRESYAQTEYKLLLKQLEKRRSNTLVYSYTK